MQTRGRVGLTVVLSTAGALAGNLWTNTVPMPRRASPYLFLAVCLIVAAVIVVERRAARRRGDIVPLTDLDSAADWLAGQIEVDWGRQAWARQLDTNWIDLVWDLNVDLSVVPEEVVRPPSRRGARKTAAARPHRQPVTASVATGRVEELHDRLYDRFRQSVLVITGAGGAGKSAAMVRLLFTTLQRRSAVTDPDVRRHRPVPVWVGISGWNPEQRTLIEHVTEVLIRDFRPLLSGPVGRDTPEELVKQRRVALFLDGLDEMPASRIDRALTAIDEVSRSLRIVLTTRPDGYPAGRLSRPLVVALRPVTVAAAVSYLRGDTAVDARPERWDKVADAVLSRPDDPLAVVLRTPLGLHLARTGFGGADGEPSDLTGLATEGEVWERLMGKFLDHAYPVRGDHGGEHPAVRRRRDRSLFLLEWLAHHTSDTRDLSWWTVPRSLPRPWLWGIGGVLLGALATITAVPAAWGLLGSRHWWVIPGAAALGVACGGLAAQRSVGAGPATMEPRLPSRDEFFQTGVTAAVIALAFGALTLTKGLTAAAWMTVGMALVVLLGIGRNADRTQVGLLTLWSVPLADSSSTTPGSSYRSDLRTTVVNVAVSLPVVAAFVAATSAFDRNANLTAGIAAGAVAGIVVGLTRSRAPGLLVLLTPAVTVLLWRRWIRIVATMEDAADRQVLRRIGAIYQFRHAGLHDHLAGRWRQRAAPSP